MFVVASDLCEAAKRPVFKQFYEELEPGDCFVGKNALLATTVEREINSLKISKTSARGVESSDIEKRIFESSGL